VGKGRHRCLFLRELGCGNFVNFVALRLIVERIPRVARIFRILRRTRENGGPGRRRRHIRLSARAIHIDLWSITRDIEGTRGLHRHWDLMFQRLMCWVFRTRIGAAGVRDIFHLWRRCGFSCSRLAGYLWHVLVMCCAYRRRGLRGVERMSSLGITRLVRGI
jgi:hypothetical protein